MMKKILLFLLLICIAAAFTSEAKASWSNGPVKWALDDSSYSHQIHQPVGHETWCGDCVSTDWTVQEPWVVNPTQCMWDVDDEFTYRSSGNILAANTTETIVECVLQSGQHIYAETKISSASSELKVKYSFTWNNDSLSFDVPAVFDKRQRIWRYDLCWTGSILSSGTYVEIPDSHGGLAIPTELTVSVYNPTSRKIGKTGGVISYGVIPYAIYC